ncbi:MAG: hypothetical protein KF901_14140 [Myxococcales bacterium]|nr:hypothetical protein [Myxococcales bacterium]
MPGTVGVTGGAATLRGTTVRVRIDTDDEESTTSRASGTVRGASRRVGSDASVSDARATVRGASRGGPSSRREALHEEVWVDDAWAHGELVHDEVLVDGVIVVGADSDPYVDARAPRAPMRAHVGLELGAATLGALRVGVDTRLQFPRGVDVDFGYAGYFDLENDESLGLGRLGLAYRALDLDYLQIRVGAKVHRLRDAAGVVTGAEWLSLGATLEHGHVSVMGDVGFGMIGRAFLVTSRASLGILLFRGVELTIGVDYANFIPVDAPGEAVPLTSVMGGLRVLL